jgi:hypothetical protein
MHLRESYRFHNIRAVVGIIFAVVAVTVIVVVVTALGTATAD